MSSLVTSVRLILLTRANVCRSPYFRAFAKVEIEYQPTTTAFYVNTTDLLVEMQNAVGSILGVIPGISLHLTNLQHGLQVHTPSELSSIVFLC